MGVRPLPPLMVQPGMTAASGIMPEDAILAGVGFEGADLGTGYTVSPDGEAVDSAGTFVGPSFRGGLADTIGDELVSVLHPRSFLGSIRAGLGKVLMFGATWRYNPRLAEDTVRSIANTSVPGPDASAKSHESREMKRIEGIRKKEFGSSFPGGQGRAPSVGGVHDPVAATADHDVVQIDEIVIADSPPLSAAELFERYRGYAMGLAGKFAPKVKSMGSFAVDEIIDAALDGLLDAAGLYDPDDSSGAKFETYAFHFIHGTMINRFAELLKFVATSEYEFEATKGGPKEDRGKRLSPATGGTNAYSDDYLVSALSEIGRRRQLIRVMGQLQDDGLLSPIEKQIISPLFIEDLDIDELSELYNFSISKLRIAVVKLLYKVRSAMRSDAAFPGKLFKIPLEDMPATNREAVVLARETLLQLRDNASGRSSMPRNLVDFKHFMPDLGYLSEVTGAGATFENRASDTARVISIYKSALGLTISDIAEALEMADSTVGQMINYGTLEQRQSLEKVRLLADTLNIDPTQILLRAIPELAGLFERTIYAGENVYLTFIDTAFSAGEIIANISRPPDSSKTSHVFGDILRAYRLWSGIPAVEDLGANNKKIETGGSGSIPATIALAMAINMPPLLAVLGTWPELMDIFDIMDSEGNLLRRSKCEYSRIVIVLRKGLVNREGPEPAGTGFEGFAKWAISRRGPVAAPVKIGPVATPITLAEYGITPKIISSVVAGRPPDPMYFRGLSKYLGLNPFEEMRMIAEILLLRGEPRQAELQKIIELARSENAKIEVIQRVGWGDLEDVATSIDQDEIRRLNDQLLSIFDTKKRPATVERGISDYIEALIEVVVPPNF